MIGLRERVPDARLLLQTGAHALVAPDEDAIAEMVQRRVAATSDAAVTGAVWTYARWKPGVSLTCAFEVSLADRAPLHVVAKRYSDGKDAHLATRFDAFDAESACARNDVWFERDGLVLWTFPTDRELDGIDVLLDDRHLARILEESGTVPLRSVRRRRIRRQILRYKPERRCVARVDVAMRDTERAHTTVGVRIHGRADGRRIAERRAAFDRVGGGSLAPRLLAAHMRHPLLVEEWLDVATPPPDSFEHAFDAGHVLASLHRFPLSNQSEPKPSLRRRTRTSAITPSTMRLFAIDPTLALSASEFDARPMSGNEAWIHGDFHPDQLGRAHDNGQHAAKDWRLLDLDCVGIGDPSRDLASWIADRMDGDPYSTYASASEHLLAGYRTNDGAAIERRVLARVVADELIHRAAGAIRRLERDAISHARRSLRRAQELIR